MYFAFLINPLVSNFANLSIAVETLVSRLGSTDLTTSW